jgi:hypothetical protein
MPWRKSSHSMGSGNCAEVAQADNTVAMRDSKDPDGAVLTFTRGEWAAFIAGVHAGEFDLAG